MDLQCDFNFCAELNEIECSKNDLAPEEKKDNSLVYMWGFLPLPSTLVLHFSFDPVHFRMPDAA